MTSEKKQEVWLNYNIKMLKWNIRTWYFIPIFVPKVYVLFPVRNFPICLSICYKSECFFQFCKGSVGCFSIYSGFSFIDVINWNFVSFSLWRCKESFPISPNVFSIIWVCKWNFVSFFYESVMRIFFTIIPFFQSYISQIEKLFSAT